MTGNKPSNEAISDVVERSHRKRGRPPTCTSTTSTDLDVNAITQWATNLDNNQKCLERQLESVTSERDELR